MSNTALSFFQRLTQSVARRLALGYAALLLAIAAVGGYALLQLEHLQRETELAETRHLDRVELVLALQSGIDRVSVHARNLVLADDALAQTQEQRLLNQQQARVDELERRLRALDWDGASLGLLDGWSAAATAVRPRLDALTRLGRGGSGSGRDGLSTALAQLRPAESAWQQQTQALTRHVTDEAETALAAHRASHLTVRQQLAGLVALCVVLGGLLSWQLVRSVRQPVKQAVRMAEKLAQGAQADLTVRGDELERMQHAMRGLQQRLRAQAVDLTQPPAASAATDATARPAAATVPGRLPVADAQRPNAALNAPVTASATAALSALVAAPLPSTTPERVRQEPQFGESGAIPAVNPAPNGAPNDATPASTEALQALLQRVQSGRGPVAATGAADGAAAEPSTDAATASASPADADALVSTAVDVAERGSMVVTQVVSNMEDISASSRKINEILATIDGIAFQTNLLALNAAVQAARAGHEGAGSTHGAVAGEVRGLAQRAASAAREIKGLINASLDQAEASNRLVRDAGVTMDALVSSVQSVTDLVGQIGTSSEARTPETLREADRSVRQLDRLTRENATLVEQSASAADALRDQAERLQKVVAAFRLLQQTQEAAWTAHTAIHSARTTSRGDTLPGGLDDLPPGGTPVVDPGLKERAKPTRKGRGKDSEPPAGNDWKNF
jgi:methyl-accepting chemotaxis protein